MKEIVDKTKFSSVKSLTRLVLSALENANLQIQAQAFKFNKTQLPPLREEGHAIAERFMTTMNRHFEALTSNTAKTPQLEAYEEDLTLVDQDYLEAIIAMEGMVNHARNSDIQQYLSFTTRLDSLFENLTIDETNNPLDPEQIGESFNEAIRPLGLKAHYLLTIYREFNKSVFHNLEAVLVEANEILINLDVIPDLDMKARNREIQKAKRAANRPTTDAQTRAFSIDDIDESKPSSAPALDTAAMFTLMQTLVHGLVEKNASTDLPIQPSSVLASADHAAIKLQQETILNVLTAVQEKLKRHTTNTEDEAGLVAGASTAITESIKQSIEDSKARGELAGIDAQSSDVINLVTMLYQAIGKDDSLPVAMKELIGRTQITTMKIALSDTTFFGDEEHPARIILNEFAMAGIAWTDPELLAGDPIYCKVKELVERILDENFVTSDFLQSLINELRSLKASVTGQDGNLEQRIRQTGDHTERLDDVHAFVRQKINERIIKPNLDPSIKNLLDTYMHEFLVKLVLKEGPGGSSWKPVMSTIDVLLWTVQTEKQAGDRERFDKINPRLLDNLGKALEIGGASKSKMTKIMRQLKQVQEFSFHSHEVEKNPTKAPAAASITEPRPAPLPRREPPPLAKDDIHLRQVDKLPIGVWLEFKGVAGQPVRCTLAAKIDSIDKMFFVNRQGVKVVELTRMRLARELKAGSVKIVSEGSLVDRALESVIMHLRDATPKSEA
jgi:hypothetical protein